MSDYLPMNEMKEGYLYRIRARNSSFGIWRESEKSFVIRRLKFQSIFTFEEYHYDTGPPYGTVRPLEELELSPYVDADFKHEVVDIDGREFMEVSKEEEILNYLKEKGKEYDED